MKKVISCLTVAMVFTVLGSTVVFAGGHHGGHRGGIYYNSYNSGAIANCNITGVHSHNGVRYAGHHSGYHY